jgi:hypothetical protein
MKSVFELMFFFIVFITLVSCKKSQIIDDSSDRVIKKKNIAPVGFFIENRHVPGVVSENIDLTAKSILTDSTTSSNSDPNNGDEPIILGQQLPNPYSVANMQQTVNTLYGGTYPITATHLYVRFKPSTTEQLMTLDETEDLELQDYPMNYELIQDGDYYQDPNQGTEDFQWLYTVVPMGYGFPQGIQMEVIEQLYLPEDNEILEDLAESMTLGAQYQSTVTNSNSPTQQNTITITRLDTQVANFDFIPDPCYCDPTIQCIINPLCDGGGGGGGTPTPTLPSGIYVEEQTVCNQPTRTLPLRQVNVVAKRWFKFWRGYTDDNGRFTVTKNFKNRVKVIVKTRNGNARVSKVRGIRLWQILFPCRKRVGVFNGSDLPNIRYVFAKPTDGSASNKDLAYWAAATTHNSIVEFRQYTTEFGLPQPPTNLHVMVTNWGFMTDAGATPMWNKCHYTNLTLYINHFITGSSLIVPGIQNFINTIRNQMDIIIGYKSTNYNCTLTSSGLRSTVYHELGHSQHFAQAGCGFWDAYRDAITLEISKFDQPEFRPYGTGADTRSAPIIATGEMWGNNCEKWYSERHYGNGGPVAATFFTTIQNTDNTFSNFTITGLNANYAALENFNPNRAQDKWRWIPQGLPYDLIDNRNDGFPVIDNVNGFTINQCFNALQPDVVSIPAFRDRLLFQNGNAQQVQVNQLFNAYNY